MIGTPSAQPPWKRSIPAPARNRAEKEPQGPTLLPCVHPQPEASAPGGPVPPGQTSPPTSSTVRGHRPPPRFPSAATLPSDLTPPSCRSSPPPAGEQTPPVPGPGNGTATGSNLIPAAIRSARSGLPLNFRILGPKPALGAGWVVRIKRDCAFRALSRKLAQRKAQARPQGAWAGGDFAG